MRSREVADLFEHVPIGTLVTIQPEKLPRYRRWTAPEPMIIAARSAPKQPGPAPLRPPVAGTAIAASSTSSRTSDKQPREPLSNPAWESRSDSFAAMQRVTFNRAPEESAANPRTEARVDSDQVASPFKGSILFADLPGQRAAPRSVSSPRPPAEVPEPVGEELKTSAASSETAGGPAPRITFRTGLSPATWAVRRMP
jgi:hypothetical protein